MPELIAIESRGAQLQLAALRDASDRDVRSAPFSIPVHVVRNDTMAAALAEALRLRDEELAESTRDNYAQHWGQFVRWVAAAYPDREISAPIDPALIGLFVGALRSRGLAKSTIAGHLHAIQYAHRLWGVDSPLRDPDLVRLRRGLARQIERPRRATNALVIEEATKLLKAIGKPNDLEEMRDRAIFCLGWCSALRCSNIAALDCEDVRIVDDPTSPNSKLLEILVRRQKTDQESGNHRLLFEPDAGQQTIGRLLFIPQMPGDHPLCAVRAVQAWLKRSQLTTGPLFRSFAYAMFDESRIERGDVAKVVKRIVAAGGGDSRRYAAHSLRRGFVTSADAAGVRKSLIREHGGWKDDRSVAVYTRIQDKVRENALRDMFSRPVRNGTLAPFYEHH